MSLLNNAGSEYEGLQISRKLLSEQGRSQAAAIQHMVDHEAVTANQNEEIFPRGRKQERLSEVLNDQNSIITRLQHPVKNLVEQ